MKNIIKIIINRSIGFLSIFIKRDRKILVIGSWFGERFSDNSRYLFQYLNENKIKYGIKKIVWITDNKDIYKELKIKKYNVAMKKSMKSIFYHLKAEFHIIDQTPNDIFRLFSVNAVKINLWHGIPLKKIGKHINNISNKQKIIEIGNWQEQYILTCSKFGDKTIGYAFDIEKGKMIHGIYPRNHYLINETFELLEIEKEFKNIIEEKKQQGKKIIFYLPTFRDKIKLKFLGDDNFQKIEEFLKFLDENNYYLITKLHFAGTFFVKREKDNINKVNEEFLNLNSDMDVYPFLKEADILITDYSSVYFDFLYLDRDIIFYPYDLEYYKNSDRGIIFDYEEMTPGDKVFNLDELKENLKIKNIKRDSYKEKRKKIKEVCFEKYTIEDTIKNIFEVRNTNK